MRNKNKNIMLDLEKITLNVREIALRAGAFLRNERSSFDRSKVEKKNAHDYVSGSIQRLRRLHCPHRP